MNFKTLEKDLVVNATQLHKDLIADMKAEGAHLADPAQCGSIVRRHFDGLTMTLLLFVALFLAAAALGIFLSTYRQCSVEKAMAGLSADGSTWDQETGFECRADEGPGARTAAWLSRKVRKAPVLPVGSGPVG